MFGELCLVSWNTAGVSPRILSKSKHNTHENITAALFITFPNRKQVNVSTGECINKMWSTHTRGHHSAVHRHAPIHTATQVNLENSMLSKRT